MMMPPELWRIKSNKAQSNQNQKDMVESVEKEDPTYTLRELKEKVERDKLENELNKFRTKEEWLSFIRTLLAETRDEQVCKKCLKAYDAPALCPVCEEKILAETRKEVIEDMTKTLSDTKFPIPDHHCLGIYCLYEFVESHNKRVDRFMSLINNYKSK